MADVPLAPFGGPTALVAGLIVGLVVAVLVVLVVRSWLRGALRRRAMQRRFRRARRAETLAERCLARDGFHIVEAQATRRCAIRVGGVPRPYVLRADYVVCRAGQRYVADVKTGAEAADVSSIATRRQLLEYRCVYDVDGVLLVDMERERVVEVDFGDLVRARARRPSPVGWVVLGVLAGALAVWHLGGVVFVERCGVACRP